MLVFMIVSSGCADGVEHRQNDIVNENRIEQPISRYACNERKKAPTPQPRSEPQLPAKPAAFEQESKTLKKEVGRGQPIAAASRKREYHLVQDPGYDEDQEECRSRSDMPVQRLEEVLVHEVGEGSIPTPAPESA